MRGHGVHSMSQCHNTLRYTKLYFMTLAQYWYIYQQNNIVYIHKNISSLNLVKKIKLIIKNYCKNIKFSLLLS